MAQLTCYKDKAPTFDTLRERLGDEIFGRLVLGVNVPLYLLFSLSFIESACAKEEITQLDAPRFSSMLGG